MHCIDHYYEINVNLGTELNSVPEEQNERCHGGVLVIVLHDGLHDGHGDGSNGEHEEGAELRHFQQDFHPQRSRPALFHGKRRVDEN